MRDDGMQQEHVSVMVLVGSDLCCGPVFGANSLCSPRASLTTNINALVVRRSIP
jgi:hypothetical protein